MEQEQLQKVVKQFWEYIIYVFIYLFFKVKVRIVVALISSYFIAVKLSSYLWFEFIFQHEKIFVFFLVFSLSC